MKKVLIVALVCLVLTGCVNDESRATSNEVSADNDVIDTTISDDMSGETETTDVWVSPEYEEEVEYNSKSNQY